MGSSLIVTRKRSSNCDEARVQDRKRENTRDKRVAVDVGLVDTGSTRLNAQPAGALATQEPEEHRRSVKTTDNIDCERRG